ncbi:DEKNAAC102421 [Brettanomyces naardenensis]|uniref:DEKNAAC102421 n=1 Tax=Brettanomyces naardenensis TaxID=13370 RepID=A0A448YL69_BRENA|nr:DEKNAAC102421 [Brettanomyces naardenensis]
MDASPGRRKHRLSSGSEDEEESEQRSGSFKPMTFKPMSFQKPSSEPAGNEVKTMSGHLMSVPGLDYHANTHDADSIDAKYQRYGIGAKLLKSMGYVEGEGLGKTSQGRVEPVTTKQRPKGMGLGAIKEKDENEYEDESSDDEVKPKAMNFELQILPSLFDLISELESEGFEVPIGIKRISDESNQDDNGSNRELRLLLQDVVTNVRLLRGKRKYMDYELSQLKEIVATADKEASTLHLVVDILSSADSNVDNTFDEIVNKVSASSEDLNSQIAVILVSLIDAKVKAMIQEWDPKSFDDSTMVIDKLHEYKMKLGKYEAKESTSSSDLTAFDSLLLRYWIPRISGFFREDWISTKQPNLGVSIIEDFGTEGLIPKGGINFILRDVILPILSRDIESEWIIDPDGATNGPEFWLVVWLDIFEEDMVEKIMESLFHRYDDWIVNSWDSEKNQVVPSKEIHLRLWLDYYATIENRQESLVESSVIKNLVLYVRSAEGFGYDNSDGNHTEYFHFISTLRANNIAEEKINLLAENEIVLPWLGEFFKLDNDSMRFKYLCNWMTTFFWKNRDLPCMQKDIELAFDYMNCSCRTGMARRFHSLSDIPGTRQIEEQRDTSIVSLVARLDQMKLEKVRKVESTIPSEAVKIKDLVDDYCKKNDLFLLPADQGNINRRGKLMFTITENMTSGITVYFEDDIIWAKIGEEFEPISVEEIGKYIN